METLPPPDKTEFLLNRLLDTIIRTHISYDKAFKTIDQRYHIPRWLKGTLYKVGYYTTLYYYSLRWLAAEKGYGRSRGAAVAFFRDIGFSVRKLKRILARETRGLNIVYKLALKHSYPQYIVKDLLEYMGPRELDRFLEKLNERRIWLRVNTLKISPGKAVEELQKQGIDVEKHHLLDYMLYVKKPQWLKPGNLDLVREGYVVPQDIASAYTVEVLAKLPGDTVLDACSAPGTKHTLIHMIDKPLQALAADKSGKRLSTLARLARLHGIDLWRTAIVNGDSASMVYSSVFDKALVDAPCSGSGAVPSDPAVKIAIERRGKLEYYRDIQISILANTLSYSRYIVYSVCSIHPLEGESVVEEIESRGYGEAVDISAPLRKSYRGFRVSNRTYRVYPHLDRGQGFYIAVLRSSRV